MVDLNILLVLMIVGAIAAIEARDVLSAVVMLGAVGLFQSLAFLVLKAPDLAIVQLVVEILSLVILLRATIRRGTIRAGIGERFAGTCLALLCAGILVTFAGSAVAALPEFGRPVMRVASHYVAKALSQTGAGNVVSSIILDYRAYDTLGEAVVLVTAVMGALAVLRRPGRKTDAGSGEGT